MGMSKLEINYTVGIYQDYKEGKFGSHKMWVSVESLIKKLTRLRKHLFKEADGEYLNSNFVLTKHIVDIIKELEESK